LEDGNMKKNNTPQEKKQEASCCGAKPKKEPKNVGQAILYGLIPHVGCIAFIIGSVLGVTVLTQLFKPLLMNKNFFYILILISLLLATISSVLYLRKTGFLSAEGIRKKWKYLSTMYGVTMGVNLLLFLVIFPLLANVSTVSAASSVPTASPPPGGAAGVGSASTASLASLTMKVAIPCSGHAPLISSELKTINGVQAVRFSLPNNFEVTYDPAKTSKDAILSLAVFKEYAPTVLSELNQIASQENVPATAQVAATPTKTAASTAGGCGCSGVSGGGCGGTGGGCGGYGGGGTGGCGGSGAGAGSGTCGLNY
jgi:hypothetical protein